MLRRAATIPEKMIKVDHAGENGAVNIYRGQKFGARLMTRDLLAEICENQEHEEEHRRIFATQLQSWGIRRCISYHLCGIGGFTLGFVTGFLGRQAIHATTYAVESVVLEHLEHQLDFLKSADQAACQCVTIIITDEQQHHDAAQGQLVAGKRITKWLIALVQFSTNSVIRFGMR